MNETPNHSNFQRYFFGRFLPCVFVIAVSFIPLAICRAVAGSYKTATKTGLLFYVIVGALTFIWMFYLGINAHARAEKLKDPSWLINSVVFFTVAFAILLATWYVRTKLYTL